MRNILSLAVQWSIILYDSYIYTLGQRGKWASLSTWQSWNLDQMQRHCATSQATFGRRNHFAVPNTECHSFEQICAFQTSSKTLLLYGNRHVPNFLLKPTKIILLNVNLKRVFKWNLKDEIARSHVYILTVALNST